MNRDMFEKSSTDKIPQGQEHKATNILREHNWYFLWQSGEWHVIDYFSPTYNTNIGLFPRGTAAIAVFFTNQGFNSRRSAENRTGICA